MFENAWDIWYLQQELDMVTRDEQINGLSELLERYKKIKQYILELNNENPNWQFGYRTPGIMYEFSFTLLDLSTDIMRLIIKDAQFRLKCELEHIAEDLYRTYGVKL